MGWKMRMVYISNGNRFLVQGIGAPFFDGDGMLLRR